MNLLVHSIKWTNLHNIFNSVSSTKDIKFEETWPPIMFQVLSISANHYQIEFGSLNSSLCECSHEPWNVFGYLAISRMRFLSSAYSSRIHTRFQITSFSFTDSTIDLRASLLFIPVLIPATNHENDYIIVYCTTSINTVGTIASLSNKSFTLTTCLRPATTCLL